MTRGLLAATGCRRWIAGAAGVALVILAAALYQCAGPVRLPAPKSFDSQRWKQERPLPMALGMVSNDSFLGQNIQGIVDLLGHSDREDFVPTDVYGNPAVTLEYDLSDSSYYLEFWLEDGLVTEVSVRRVGTWLAPLGRTVAASDGLSGSVSGGVLSAESRDYARSVGGVPAAGMQLWAVTGAAADTEAVARGILSRARAADGILAKNLTIQVSASTYPELSDRAYAVTAFYEDGRQAQLAYAEAFGVPGLGRPYLELVFIQGTNPVVVGDRADQLDRTFDPNRWAESRPASMAAALASTGRLYQLTPEQVGRLLGEPDWRRDSLDIDGATARLDGYELGDGETLRLQYRGNLLELAAVY